MAITNQIHLGLFVLLTILALTAASPIPTADEVAKISTSQHFFKKLRRKIKRGFKKIKRKVKRVGRKIKKFGRKVKKVYHKGKRLYRKIKKVVGKVKHYYKKAKPYLKKWFAAQTGAKLV